LRTNAAIPIALVVGATAVADAVFNIIPGATATFRWAADVVCVISTIAVVIVAPLSIAFKVTIVVIEGIFGALGHITCLRIIAAITAIPIAFRVEAIGVASTVVVLRLIVISFAEIRGTRLRTIGAIPAIPITLLGEAACVAPPVAPPVVPTTRARTTVRRSARDRTIEAVSIAPSRNLRRSIKIAIRVEAPYIAGAVTQ
jgi:hypothetical protein